MKVRKLSNQSEIKQIVEIWYEVSIKAHDFISKDYWKQNKEAMIKTYLPNSETYLAIIDDEIVWFVSIIDNFLAAIFVKTNRQGRWKGFKAISENIDENTNEIELLMKWNKLS